MTALIENIVSS